MGRRAAAGGDLARRAPRPGALRGEFSGSERRWPATCWPRCSSASRRRCASCCCAPRCSSASAARWPTPHRRLGVGGDPAALEDANAFVTSLDVGRTWFRYHHLFADLLQLELRRAVPGADRLAAPRGGRSGTSEHGHVVEAIRHAQAARDWAHAARLLADNYVDLIFDGRTATVRALLDAFPADAARGRRRARAGLRARRGSTTASSTRPRRTSPSPSVGRDGARTTARPLRPAAGQRPALARAPARRSRRRAARRCGSLERTRPPPGRRRAQRPLARRR